VKGGFFLPSICHSHETTESKERTKNFCKSDYLQEDKQISELLDGYGEGHPTTYYQKVKTKTRKEPPLNIRGKVSTKVLRCITDPSRGIAGGSYTF